MSTRQEVLQGIIPDGFDFETAFITAMTEVLKPAGKLEMLKRREVLTTKEVALLYGIPASSLTTWRTRGGGPEYVQPYKNGPVTYTHEAIRNFLFRSRMLSERG